MKKEIIINEMKEEMRNIFRGTQKEILIKIERYTSSGQMKEMRLEQITPIEAMEKIEITDFDGYRTKIDYQKNRVILNSDLRVITISICD